MIGEGGRWWWNHGYGPGQGRAMAGLTQEGGGTGF